MDSLKATPGPWQRSGVRVKLAEHDCLAVGPDSFSIAFLPIGRRPNEQAGAIANAHLIAAAPELYEALEKTLPFLGSAATRSQIICGVDAGELYFVVEAALAKARGEAE